MKWPVEFDFSIENFFLNPRGLNLYFLPFRVRSLQTFLERKCNSHCPPSETWQKALSYLLLNWESNSILMRVETLNSSVVRPTSALLVKLEKSLLADRHEIGDLIVLWISKTKPSLQSPNGISLALPSSKTRERHAALDEPIESPYTWRLLLRVSWS